MLKFKKVVYPPLEALIEEVKAVVPDLEKHHALFVWCEGEYWRADGGYARELHAPGDGSFIDPQDPERRYQSVCRFFKRMTSDGEVQP